MTKKYLAKQQNPTKNVIFVVASEPNGCVAECDSKFDYLDINRRCRSESGYWWRYCWLLWSWLWWYGDDNDDDSIDQVYIDSRRGILFHPTHLFYSKAEQDSLMTRKSISNPIYRTHLIGGIGKRNEKSHVHLYFGIPAKNIARLVTAMDVEISVELLKVKKSHSLTRTFLCFISLCSYWLMFLESLECLSCR